MSLSHFVHNEYFGIAGKSICDCKSKGLQIYFWGSYLGRIYHHIKFFCPKCYDKEVKENLITQKDIANCQINIKGFRGERLPEFLLELRDILNGKPQLRLLPDAKIEVHKISPRIGESNCSGQLRLF